MQYGQLPQPAPASIIERGGKSVAQWIRSGTTRRRRSVSEDVMSAVPSILGVPQFQLATRFPTAFNGGYGTRDGENFQTAVENRFDFCDHETCQGGANAQIHVHANGRTIWYGVSKPDGAVFPRSARWPGTLAFSPCLSIRERRGGGLRLRCHYSSMRIDAIRINANTFPFDAVPLRQIHSRGTGRSASSRTARPCSTSILQALVPPQIRSGRCCRSLRLAASWA